MFIVYGIIDIMFIVYGIIDIIVSLYEIIVNILLTIFVICMMLIAASLNYIFPSAQIYLPFQAGVEGSVVETQFHASRTKFYTFYLDLHFRDGDSQDAQRVSKLAGTGAHSGSGPNSYQVDTGLPIPIHLSVGRVGAATQWSILDAYFSSYDLEGAGSGSFDKIITEAKLEPGDYRVRIEALKNIPELDGTPVSLDIHVRPY